MGSTSGVAAAQGAYYAAAGLWSLVGIRSFEAVTGPKRERWLVKTVGALALATGATLLLGSKRQGAGAGPAHARLLRDLGTSTAAAFAAVDAWYVAKGRISPVYLGDATAQLALILAWQNASRRERTARHGLRGWGQPAFPSGRGVVSGTQAMTT